MMQSLCITLQQQEKEKNRTLEDLQIDVVAPTWSLPVVQRMPEVTNAIALDVPHGKLGLQACRQLGKKLRAEKYDRSIVIPRSWKSALVPFFAKIPQRTGYRGEMRYGLLNDIRELDKIRLKQTVQRYVALAPDKETIEEIEKEVNVPFLKLQIDLQNRENLKKEYHLDYSEKKIIALLPGAEYGPAKQWPLEYFAEVGQKLFDQGNQVIILGSKKDFQAGEKIFEISQRTLINLCGKTRIEDAVDLLSACEKVITNDSGLMHVAAAVGTEVIAIYGSSTPEYTPPLTGRKKVYYLGLECSPCFDRKCYFKHLKCLNNISPSHVI